MVMTILEANVPPDKAAILEGVYEKEIQSLDTGIVQTFLTKSRKDSTLYRIITLWESQEVLDAMREQGTPRGVLMFREAGVDPRLTVSDVVRQG